MKFQPQYQLRCCLNLYFTSNHDDALYADDDDRRLFVWKVPNRLDRGLAAEVSRWLSEGGKAALLHHFMNLDLSGFDPYARAMRTEAKNELIDQNLSDLDRFARDLVDRLRSRGQTEPGPGDLFRLPDLVDEFDQGHRKKAADRGMLSSLKKALLPFGLKPVQLNQVRLTDGDWVRAWALANQNHWSQASDAEIRVALERKRARNASGQPKF